MKNSALYGSAVNIRVSGAFNCRSNRGDETALQEDFVELLIGAQLLCLENRCTLSWICVAVGGVLGYMMRAAASVQAM